MASRPAQAGPFTGILLACAVTLTACTETPVRPSHSGNAHQGAARLTIAAVGDIMLGTDFPQDRLPPEDGASLLEAVADQIREADIAFGNLEATLADGIEAKKQCQTGPCYLFRTPSRYARHLKRAG